MTPILENAQLGNDLDCQNLSILNILHMYPVPSGLVDRNDPTLYDPRVPPFASIEDVHVSAAAGIRQGKLLLNGTVPSPWLGTADNQAAPGNLVEVVAHKGAPGGYAALDANGKIPSAHFTPTANPGTVNHVELSMPPQFSVSGSPITSSDIFKVTWQNTPDQSWFGVNGLTGLSPQLVPSFLTGQLPVALVPPLGAAKFTTGKFITALLPTAAGLGSGHSIGILPDPGAVGGPTEYIGRDMQWHPFNPGVNYQPAAPKPNIVLLSWNGTQGVIRIFSALKDSSLFYRVTNPEVLGSAVFPFIPVYPDNSITINVNNGYYVEAYVAKAGYNNSGISAYTVAIPSPT